MSSLFRVLAFAALMLGWWALVTFAWELGAAAVGAGLGWMFRSIADRLDAGEDGGE